MSTNTPWPKKIDRELRRQRAKEAVTAVALLMLVLGIVFGCALLLTGCMAHSDWYPAVGSTLTDCERVMGRPADRVTDNVARWFLNGNLEAYAEFDRNLQVRGIIVIQDGKVRQRHDFEIPRLTYFEWNGSAYNSMEPHQ